MWSGAIPSILIIALIVVQFAEYDCLKSRPATRAPTHRTTHRQTTHRTTYRAPTYHTTTRAPTYRTTTRATTYRTTTYRPSTYHTTTRAPTYRTTTRSTTRYPMTTTPWFTTKHTTTRAPTYRTTTRSTTRYPMTTTPWFTTARATTRAPTYRTTTSRTVPWTTTRYTSWTTRSTTYWPTFTNRPTTRWTTTRAPTYRTTPIGPRPTYPGYGGGGRPLIQPSYSVPLRTPSANGGKIKVYNINNYHSPGYWAPPSYPVYHYTNRDTGSSALGFYLGYSLGRINSPTYYHSHSLYDGYSPRYDHYTVHHYYHNNNNVPPQQTVTTKVIIQCGDGSQICPANTQALCTANGQIMCVVVAQNTIPCTNNATLRCVKSYVPCENNEAPECKGLPKGQNATIDIPCISNTTIEGNVTTVNNTIISADKNSTFPSLGAKTKREVPPQYCVTVLAQPTQRQPTEGELAFNAATSIFEKFFAKAFKMDRPVNKPENVIPSFGD